MRKEQLRFMVSVALLVSTLTLINSMVYGASIGLKTQTDQRLESNITQDVSISVSFDDDGQVEFIGSTDDFRWLSQPGEPAIPWRVVTLLVAGDADLDSAQCLVENTVYVPVKKSVFIEATKPMGTWVDDQPVEIWPEDKTIVDGKDTAIYSVDKFWTGEFKVLSRGTLDQWQLVEVAVPLVRFNPVSEKAELLDSCSLTIDCLGSGVAGTANVNSSKVNPHLLARVKELAANYNAEAATYTTLDTASAEAILAAGDNEAMAPSNNYKGYAIITTNNIVSRSSKLSNFITHKRNKGYTVYVVTENDYGTASGQNRAINIRTWLKNNYISKTLKYVMMLGNPDPETGDLPMKMCISDHPTDYFYAELTVDWDKDGDGIYGEEGGDAGSGNEVEKYFEVYCGRLPYYGNTNDLDHMLQKIMDYENEESIDWRRNAILPMVPLDDATQAYQLGEQIKRDCLTHTAIRADRVYEKEYGLVPPPEYPRTEPDTYPADVWGRGKYGMNIWQTHGWSQGASGIISSGEVGRLNDNYPSACFQGSCMTGDPDASDNLGFSLMKNGAIATIAASRNGWYWVGETNFTNSSSVGGMAYQYAKRLTQKMTVGKAIWETKESQWLWLKNYYVYNLYGDPSLVVYPRDPKFTSTPPEDLWCVGVTGKQIDPTTKEYTIYNTTTDSVVWTTDVTEDWVVLSSTGGTMSPQSNITVSVSLADDVVDMPPGTYECKVTFTDTTHNESFERNVKVKLGAQSMWLWGLDETSGTTAYESGQGKNNGHLEKIAGDETVDWDYVPDTGRYDGGLTFNSSEQTRVRIEDINVYSRQMTITAWVKRDGNQQNYTGIVFNRAKAAAGLRIRTDNMLGYEWNQSGGSSGWQSGLVLPNQQWIFTALVLTNSRATLYMGDDNGLQSASRTENHPLEPFSGTTYIGRDPDGTRYFNGSLDDVRIYNYALSEDDIEALAAGGYSTNPSPASNTTSVSELSLLKWNPGYRSTAFDVYFGTDYEDVANADRSSDSYQGERMYPSFNPGMMSRENTYFWRVDDVFDNGQRRTGDVWTFTPSGSVTREVWFDIQGTAVSDLTGNSAYPDYPDEYGYLTRLEGPTDIAEYYGTQIQGYVIAPVTGTYVFYVAGDDNSELWLSTNSNPQSAHRIAYVPGSTSSRDWTRYGEQKSSNINLTAGQKCYIKVLQKEHGGGDNIAVGWRLAQYDNIEVIEGQYLAPYNSIPQPRFANHMIELPDAREGIYYQYTILSTIADPADTTVFEKIAGPEWLTVNANGQIAGIPNHKDAGLNKVKVKISTYSDRFDEAEIHINVIGTSSGLMGMSDLVAFNQNWLGEMPDATHSDINGDGAVNLNDWQILTSQWEQGFVNDLVCSVNFNAVDENTMWCAYGPYYCMAEQGSQYLLPGKVGMAYGFNDDNPILSIEGYKGILGTESHSVSAWFKTSTKNKNQVIFSWGTLAANELWMLHLDTSGRAEVITYGGTCTGTSIVNDGQWHHVVVSLEDHGASTTTNHVKLYIDGMAENCSRSVKPINITSGMDVQIGGIHTDESVLEPFDGMIDEFNIYNKVLSSDEIFELGGNCLAEHYTFDSMTDDVVPSACALGHDGFANGTPYITDNAVAGGAMKFNGTSDYVQISGYKGVAGSGARTISMWINVPAWTATRTLASWGTLSDDSCWILQLSRYKRLQIFAYGGICYFDTNLSYNEWHHVVAVLDDHGHDTSASDIRLYMDGQLLSSSITAGKIYTKARNDVLVGALYEFKNSPVEHFSGMIDDFRIYERALSTSDIQELYQDTPVE